MFTVNTFSVSNYLKHIEPGNNLNETITRNKPANVLAGLSFNSRQPEKVQPVKFSSNIDGDIFQLNFSTEPEIEMEDEKRKRFF